MNVLMSKFRYKIYLNFDVKRFEKYSFSYGTSQIIAKIIARIIAKII